MVDVDVYYQPDREGLTLREIPRYEPKYLPCSDAVCREVQETYARSTMLKCLCLANPKATFASTKLRVVLNDGDTKQPSKYDSILNYEI